MHEKIDAYNLTLKQYHFLWNSDFIVQISMIISNLRETES